MLAGLLDINRTMELAGAKSLGVLNRSMPRRITYGGDVKYSL